MKQPIKPQEPTKPTPPEEYDLYAHDLDDSLGLYETYTLEQILAKLKSQNVQPEDLRFRRTSHDGGSWMMDSFDYVSVYYIEKRKNKSYAKQLKKHEKAFQKYETEMIVFKKALDQYEADMKVWVLQVKKRQASTLKKEIKELEGKKAK